MIKKKCLRKQYERKDIFVGGFWCPQGMPVHTENTIQEVFFFLSIQFIEVIKEKLTLRL